MKFSLTPYGVRVENWVNITFASYHSLELDSVLVDSVILLKIHRLETSFEIFFINAINVMSWFDIYYEELNVSV